MDRGPVGENIAGRVVRGGQTAPVVERELVLLLGLHADQGVVAQRGRAPDGLARDAVPGDLDAAAALAVAAEARATFRLQETRLGRSIPIPPKSRRLRPAFIQGRSCGRHRTTPQ